VVVARDLIILAAGFLCGVAGFEGPVRYDHWVRAHNTPKIVAGSEFTKGRQEISTSVLEQSHRVMVALVFGQSNASNVGRNRKRASERVLNFFEGKLYRAEDPLLGADDVYGSVWTRLGDLLVEQKIYDRVVVIPVAISGSVISRWRPEGDIHPLLLHRLRDAKAGGLTITHLLWHQGEADAKRHTSKKDYQDSFLAMLSGIRSEGVSAPIYVSVATRCVRQRLDPIIQSAQRDLVDPEKGILAGPNTDTLGFEYRYDGCHFLDEGLDAAARLWLEALLGDARTFGG
jgi:hypothetical protein